jgi:hypothetical protein
VRRLGTLAVAWSAAGAALAGLALVYAGLWAPGVTLALVATGLLVLVGRARP